MNPTSTLRSPGDRRSSAIGKTEPVDDLPAGDAGRVVDSGLNFTKLLEGSKSCERSWFCLRRLVR